MDLPARKVDRLSGIPSRDPQHARQRPGLALALRPGRLSLVEARHAVRAFCVNEHLAHLADDAELLTSELVTNAIEHARTRIRLIARCQDDMLFVEVFDEDANPMVLVAALADPSSEGGRGLHLVTAIAAECGVNSRAGGKSVWFKLA